MSVRLRLPSRRAQELVEFDWSGLRFTVGVGRFHGGRVAEVFLSAHKIGSPVEALARDAAIILSLALQHGAPLEVLQSALTTDQDGRPASLIGAALAALEGCHVCG